MSYKLLLSIFLAGFILNACNRKNVQHNSDTDKMNPELPRFLKTLSANDTLALNTDTLLYFQKSACFGFCPTYNYTIYQTGLVRYEGLQHVDVIGTRYALISDSWWKEVMQQIQLTGFFELANVYPLDEKMYIPDLPNTILIIKEFGKRKSVIDNHNAPDSLKKFEAFLEMKLLELKLNK